MAVNMTSQEALNSIFTLLSAVVDQQDSGDKKEASVRVSGEDAMLVSLLKGMVETNSSEQIGMTGDALEKLSKGVVAVNETGMKTFTNVAASINILNGALNSLSVGKEVANNIDNLIKVIDKLAQIEVRHAENLVNFINALTLENPKAALQSIQAFHNILTGFSTLVSLDIDKVIKQLNKLEKNKDVTKAIGNFMTELAKNTEGIDKLGKEAGKNIASVLESLSKIGSVNMWKLMFTFHPFAAKRVAKAIAGFIEAIAKALDKKTINENVKHIEALLKPLVDLGSKDSKFNIFKLKLTLNETNAETIGTFFSSLIEKLPSNKDTKKLESVAKILEILLEKIDKKGVNAIVYMGKHLKEEYGENIGSFIAALCKAEVDEKKVEATTKIIEAFGNLLIKAVICFAVLVLLVTIFPLTSILLGMATMYVMIKFMKKVVTDIVSELVTKDVKDASNTINAISLMMLAMTVSIAILVLVTAMAPITDVLMGVGIFMLVVFSAIQLIKTLSDKEFSEGLEQASSAIYAISVMFIAISVSIMLITSVFTKNDPGVVWQGALMIMGIVGLSVGLVYLLSLIEAKDLEHATSALYAITVCLAAVSIIAVLILPSIGEEAGMVALGALVVITIVAAMVGIVWLINKVGNEEVTNSLIALGVITVCFWILSLVAKSVLIPVGEEIGPALLGALTVTLIVLAMVGCVKLISMIGNDEVTNALIALGSLTIMFWILSLVTKSILIPIGRQAKEALFGAGIVVGILGLLIGGLWLITKIKKEDLFYGIAGVAAVALIALFVALITKEILIPIGAKAEEALYGASIVVGLLGILSAGVYLIGRADKETLLKGVVFVALTALILLGVSLITKELLIPIGEKAVDALKGAGSVILILGAIGGITYFVGKYADKMIEELVVGMVLVTLLSAFIGLLGIMLTPFIMLAIHAGKNAGDLLIGAASILGMLAGIGLITAAIGAMALNPIVWIALGVGMAMMAALTVATVLLMSIALTFNLTVKTLKGYKKEDYINVAEACSAMFKAIYKILGAASPSLRQLWSLASGTAAMLGLLPAVLALAAITKAIKLVISSINTNDVQKFIDICIGEKGLIEALRSIVTNVSNFGVFATIGARIISKSLMPIIDTVSYFIDVIKKAATMQIIAGYDKNGKPVYERLPGSVFVDAATAVSTGFQTFVTTIYDTFKEMSVWTMRANASIAKAMNPIIDVVSKFVDIVIKVATLRIVSGYDKNGKPKYEQISPGVFTEAAKAVSTSFRTFLEELKKGFDELGKHAPWVIRQLGNSMKPVMDCIGKFVDVVIKVAKMQIVTGYDKDGHPKYDQLTPTDFTNAATAVTTQFINFLTSLGESMTTMEPLSDSTIKTIGKNIMPVMTAISSFADTIIKLSSATYSEWEGKYDKDGKPIYIQKRITDQMLKDSATAVANTFNRFLQTLATNFESKDFRKATEKALKAIGKNIEPVMNSIADWGEVIFKLATGTVTVTKTDASGNIIYGKDGKPEQIVKTVSKEEYKNAASAITVSFVSFLKTLTVNMKTLAPLAEEVMGYMKDGIEPVMKGVKLFTDSILPFVVDKKDDKGNTTAKAINPDTIKVVANKIADAFVSFVDIIATSLSNEEFVAKYTAASEHMPSIKKTMDQLNDSVESLSAIIKNLSDKNGNVLSTGEAVAKQFLDSLHAFISGIDPTVYNYGELNDVWRDAINPMLKLVNNATSTLNEIINSLNIKDANKTVLIDELISILNKLTIQGSDMYNRIGDMDFGKITSLMHSFKNSAYVLDEISQYMLNHENLTAGIDLFIKNLDHLTSAELNKKIVNQGASLTAYRQHLKQFSVQVESTTSTVTVYVTELEKAREALMALDDQIINNEKKRNDALQSFADKVDNIANAVNNLKSAFDNLNENQILSQFENIRKFLETINDDIDTNVNVNVNKNTTTTGTPANNAGNRTTTGTPVNTGNKTTPRTPANNTGNNKQNNNNTVQQVQQVPMSGRNINVVFRFKDIDITGFMDVTNK